MTDRRDIVIKSFNGIGDLLFVTPTLRRIKEAYGTQVHINVNTNHPTLLMGNPYVDEIGTKNEGVFLGYDDPIHAKNPTCHHIQKDWEIVTSHYELETEPPLLEPELYCVDKNKIEQKDEIGVQVIHKGHWHKKKVWPGCLRLSRFAGFEAIPKFRYLPELISYIAGCSAVVCSEGGISHLAKALQIPAIVIYGGFAKPEWNGYEDQINVTNDLHCSYCYNPGPCTNEIERKCMKTITAGYIRYTSMGIRKNPVVEQHNQAQFVFDDAQLWCWGKGLDVGAGKHPFEGARPIELNDYENAYRIVETDNSMDYVFSSHCLEHLENPSIALKEWSRVLKEDGIMYLYLPHPDYLPWRSSRLKWHKHDFHLKDVVNMLDEAGCYPVDIIEKDSYYGQRVIAVKTNRSGRFPC